MPLRLQIDPSQLVQGAAQAKDALAGVGTAAGKAQSAIDVMADQGGKAWAPATAAARLFETQVGGVTQALKFDTIAFDANMRSSTAMGAAFAAVTGEGTRARVSIDELTGTAARNGLAFDTLRLSLDSTYASQRRYETAVETINTALRSQVITQEEATRATQLASAAYLTTDRATTQAVRGINAMSAAHRGSAMASRAGSMGIQNAAFQVADFAVQVGAGTSATRALAQQLPQLLGGFGVMGAVIGGVVAVAGALAPMLFNIGENSKSAADKLDDITAALGQYRSAAQDGTRTTAELRAEFGDFADEVARTTDLMIRAATTDALKGFAEAVSPLFVSLGDVNKALIEQSALEKQIAFLRTNGTAGATEQIFGLSVALEDAKAATLESAIAIGMTSDQVLTLDRVLGSMRGVKTISELRDRSQEALDAILSMFPAGQAIPEAIAPIVARLTEVRDTAAAGVAMTEGFTPALNNATTAAGGLATAMSGVAMSANAALSQMIQMDLQRRTLQGAAQGQAAAPHGIGPAGMGDGNLAFISQEAAKRAAAKAAADRLANAPALVFGSTGTGSSGAAAIDSTRDAFDQLLATLDPLVSQQHDMADAQQTINAALAAGTINAEEAANAMDLVADKFGNAADSMASFRDAGANAFDALIEGTGSVRSVIQDLIKDIGLAIVKQQLLKSVSGATAGMSIGGILMQALTGGLRDGGGMIGNGKTAMVGEYGPELVTPTAGGAMVTSRAKTAQMAAGGALSGRIEIGVTVDDDGKIKAMVRSSSIRAAQSGAQAAIDTVRRSLGGWQDQLAMEGALA